MSQSRGKKALISSVVSCIFQIVNIVSALIIPRLIIGTFGSEINGMISSITQFLGYSSLLQMGIGGVVRASLYKPLSQNDSISISRIMKATNSFFTKIAFICVGYIIILSLIYPIISTNNYSYSFIATLVLICGLSTCVQYFFGFSYRSLVMADQRIYLYDFLQIISVISNILLTYLMIKLGFGIHLVKLISSVAFILLPLVLKIYCDKKYRIDKESPPDNSALAQRWDGASYSIADFIHRNTDVFLLTIFRTFSDVSVYSVYSVVTNGLNSIVSIVTNPFGAAMGDMIAREEKDALRDTFSIYVFISHFLGDILFAVAMIMVIPFVRLYTFGITDVEYIQPLFSVLILVAELLYCLRQPLQTLIYSGGFFKETKIGAFIEAFINIVISIILVFHFGLVGIAIGTLVAMLYRTIDLMVYINKNMAFLNIKKTIKHYLISFLGISLAFSISFFFNLTFIDTFSEWILVSIIVVLAVSLLILLLNLVFFRDEMFRAINKIKGVLKRG